MLGDEVESDAGGRFCDQVWTFDTERIEDSGSYVRIAKQLSRIADQPDALSDLRNHVDLDDGEGWLEYVIDGERKRWDVAVQDDWADLMVVSYLIDDLERNGRKFYVKDNGSQILVLSYLDDKAARAASTIWPAEKRSSPSWRRDPKLRGSRSQEEAERGVPKARYRSGH